MTIASHQLDVYGMWVHVATRQKDWRRIRKAVSHTIQKNVDSVGLTVRTRDSDGVFHLVVFIAADRLGPAGLVEVCAHEAAHVATMLFDEIGQKVSWKSEPYAYLTGWATSFIWQAASGILETAS